MSLKKLYLYLVSLITFVMSLVGSYFFVSNLIDIVMPEPPYQQTCNDTADCAAVRKTDMDRTLIVRKRNLLQSGVFLAIVIPAYAYHWKQARKLED